MLDGRNKRMEKKEVIVDVGIVVAREENDVCFCSRPCSIGLNVVYSYLYTGHGFFACERMLSLASSISLASVQCKRCHG